MSLRSTLRRAAGLLVEFPEEEVVQDAKSTATASEPVTPESSSRTDTLWASLERDAGKPKSAPVPTRTIDEIVRSAPGPSLDQIKVAAESLPAAAKDDGGLDFDAIYRSASLPSAPFTAEQVLQMIEALPRELPLETRRQTVRVSIDAVGRTIGATPENILADASRKLAALTAYGDRLSQMTGEFTAMAEKKIATLQAQIDETQRSIEAAKAREVRETKLCTEESHRLDDVLEFFSLDVPPSRYAEPGIGS